MAGWHHQLYGHEFERAPGDGDGQGVLAYCGSWGHKELDMTERLDGTDPLQDSWASLVAQLVKNLPAMQETWVRSLGWEDPLEKGIATHSIILAWRIPWTEEPGGLQSTGSQKSQTGLSDFPFHFAVVRSPRFYRRGHRFNP